MEITCEKCQAKLKLPDDKIPKDRPAKLTCPKCKNKLSVSVTPAAEKEQPAASTSGGSGFDFDYDYSDKFETSDKAFDFIEDEGKTALICETDPEIIATMKPVLEFMEYHITEVKDSRDAIKQMRYHNFDLILINEKFDARDPDANGVLIYLSRLHMSMRRNIFVTMITNRYRTMDFMMTLNKSVNLIVNTENLNQFEGILKKGLSDGDMFYRIYSETLKSTGVV